MSHYGSKAGCKLYFMTLKEHYSGLLSKKWYLSITVAVLNIVFLSDFLVLALGHSSIHILTSLFVSWLITLSQRLFENLFRKNEWENISGTKCPEKLGQLC